MEQLPKRTEMFRKHGGIHCSMLADMKEKSILVSREDIGRSNSVDKVIGWGLVHGVDFSPQRPFHHRPRLGGNGPESACMPASRRSSRRPP